VRVFGDAPLSRLAEREAGGQQKSAEAAYVGNGDEASTSGFGTGKHGGKFKVKSSGQSARSTRATRFARLAGEAAVPTLEIWLAAAF